MRFTDYDQASTWRRNKDCLVQILTAEVERISGVSYTEDWLCGKCPSFIAGFNEDDEMIVCLPFPSDHHTMA